MARQAFDDAVLVMDQMDQETADKSVSLIKMLRDNWSLWTNAHPCPDYVFDFDMDDAAPQVDPDEPVSWTPPQPPRTFSRTRNMVEANLSHTFAADAPSHRSAWKRHLMMWQTRLRAMSTPGKK